MTGQPAPSRDCEKINLQHFSPLLFQRVSDAQIAVLGIFSQSLTVAVLIGAVGGEPGWEVKIKASDRDKGRLPSQKRRFLRLKKRTQILGGRRAGGCGGRWRTYHERECNRGCDVRWKLLVFLFYAFLLELFEFGEIVVAEIGDTALLEGEVVEIPLIGLIDFALEEGFALGFVRIVGEFGC
jgi:hypothetical protein